MRKRFYFESGDAIGFRRSLENKKKDKYDGGLARKSLLLGAHRGRA